MISLNDYLRLIRFLTCVRNGKVAEDLMLTFVLTILFFQSTPLHFDVRRNLINVSHSTKLIFDITFWIKLTIKVILELLFKANKIPHTRSEWERGVSWSFC